MLDYLKLAAGLLNPVLEAGAIEMHYYKSGVTVETKKDLSPVTVADQEAEAVLIAGIKATAPGIPIVAEESVAAGHLPDLGDTFFLVDPLDGTREFINHRDEFTVNIALIEHGIPTFGIVYVPALGDFYVTLGPKRGALVRIAPEKSANVQLNGLTWNELNARKPDAGGLTAVASRSHLTPETEAFLSRFAIASRRDAGSSLKFCLIAKGDADIYPRLAPTMAWDTAAGHAVLLAAGGSVTELSGAPLRYGLSKSGTAHDCLRNPHFVAWGASGPIRTSR